MAEVKAYLKVPFIILNLIVFAAGGVAIGLGAWSMASDYGAKEMKAMTGTELYTAGCVVAIVAGCVVSLIALAGILLVCWDNSDDCCCYNWYVGAVSSMLCLFIAAAVVTFFFRGSMEEMLSKEMEITLRTKYNVSYATNDENKFITDVWNKIQIELKCCGVKDAGKGKEAWRSYKDSEFFKQQTGMSTFKQIYNTIENGLQNGIYLVPPSCCVPGHIIECQTVAGIGFAIESLGTPFLSRSFTDEIVFMHKIGCVDALENLITANIGAIAGVAIGLIVLMIIAIMMAVGIERNKKRSSSPV